MGSTLRRLALPALLLALPACGTINSVASGCPGKYSGVQQDLELIRSYRSIQAIDSEVPVGFDGRLGDAWDLVFVSFDVPLSAVLDTLALPATIGMDARAPDPPALGCGWASASAEALSVSPDPS